MSTLIIGLTFAALKSFLGISYQLPKPGGPYAIAYSLIFTFHSPIHQQLAALYNSMYHYVSKKMCRYGDQQA